jgi:hypothetical protein
MGVSEPNSGIFFGGCPPLICKGVQTGPGSTLFTRIPSAATYLASARVNARIAALVSPAHLHPYRQEDDSEGLGGSALIADELSRVFAMNHDGETHALGLRSRRDSDCLGSIYEGPDSIAGSKPMNLWGSRAYAMVPPLADDCRTSIGPRDALLQLRHWNVNPLD